jgi:hypothetical protein
MEEVHSFPSVLSLKQAYREITCNHKIIKRKNGKYK